MSEPTKDLVKQLHSISYRMLSDIDKFCEDHNLTYYLSGGSCLGAVRDHGFIPWDDDVDIMMPRPDYERFLEIFGPEYMDRYGIGSLNTDPNWSRPCARIWDLNTEVTYTKINEVKMGVFIDIFPIDGMPKHIFSQKIFFGVIKILSVLRNASKRKEYYENEKYRVTKKILKYITKPFGPRFFSVQLEKIAKKYPFESSEYVGASMALHYGMREKIERKCMERGIRVPFESGEFPVPIGYDKYLRNLYGDYMKIPEDAEEKGYTHLDGWEVKIKKDN